MSLNANDFRTLLENIDKKLLNEDLSFEEAEDAIEELEDIQRNLFELRDRLADAIRAYLPEEYDYWKSYGLAQLAVIAGSDEYMSHDESINSLISKIENKISDDDEEF